MKHLYTFILLTTLLFPLHAQLNGDGFYRVQNVKTKRYISVIDSKGSINVSSTQADLGAIQTIKGFDRAAIDPSTVIYIEKVGEEYDLIAQGTSVYGIVGITVEIRNEGGFYQAYKSHSGISRYLYDLDIIDFNEGFVTTTGYYKDGFQNWYIKPITEQDQYYLAVNPTIYKDGHYYQTYYSSYGFNFNNQEDKAYYISQIDNNVAVYNELLGTVPASTPVIICGKSNVVSEHKITPLRNTPAAVTDNKLTGTYFCSSVSGHINRIINDATIRMLGILSDGSLGFKKDASLSYVPHNTAYLKVAATAPDEIQLMSEEEYNRWKAPVTLTAVNITREYGEDNPELTYTIDGKLLGGTPVLSCEATATSPAGTYPITIAKGDVENAFTELVNGTLTITPAPLTVKVGSYTRKYGEDNPVFEVTYEGWKNGDDI